MAQLATKALAFVSIPILTRLFSPADYGVINLYNSAILILIPIMSLNANASVGRYYFEEKQDFNAFFTTSAIISYVLILAFSALLIIFRPFFSTVLNIPVDILPFVLIMVAFYTSNSFFEQIYQSKKESRRIAIRSVIQRYGGFAIGIVLILLLPARKYFGYIYAEAGLGILFFVYYIFQLKQFIQVRFSWSHVTYILKYSIPLLPYALSSIILTQFSRIIVNAQYGLAQTGIYSFALNIGSLLVVFSSAVYSAWLPYYFELMNKKDYDQIRHQVINLFKLIIVAACFLIFFGKEIGMVLAKKDFHSSLYLVPIITIGFVFEAVFSMYAWNFGYTRKTIFNSIVVLSCGVLNIFLNILFIPMFGPVAGAFTSLVSYFLMAFSCWFISIKILKLNPVPLRQVLIILLVFVPFIVLYYLIIYFNISLGLSVIIKLSGLLLLAAILFRSYFPIMVQKIRSKFSHE